MNKKGHSKTLVAAHAENVNAVKAGVFSDRILAPRVRELEQAIEERPVAQVALEFSRYDVAALAALIEAMDQSLATTGPTGRKGDPRTMISLRLRASERLHRAVERYGEAARAAGLTAAGAGADDVEDPLSLPDTIAKHHHRASIADIAPHEFDGEAYLRAFIICADAAVTTRDRQRARKMLTRHFESRRDVCRCFSTLVARDEIEFHRWVDEARDATEAPDPLDERVAACVRSMERGARDRLPVLSQRMESSFDQVVAAARARAVRRPATAERHLQLDDPAVQPFWEVVISSDMTVPAKERLSSFEALDELEVFQRCKCEPLELPLIEKRADEVVAYVVQMVSRRHYRAALVVANFPETFLAVRTSVDNAILAENAEAA